MTNQTPTKYKHKCKWVTSGTLLFGMPFLACGLFLSLWLEKPFKSTNTAPEEKS